MPMHSSPPFRSFPKVAPETVPMLVWLITALAGPRSADRRSLSFCTSLSRRHSTVWWCSWLFSSCCRCSLTALNTSDLPNHSPVVMVAVPASRSALSFPFPPAWPGQYTQSIFWMSKFLMALCQSGLPIPALIFSTKFMESVRSQPHVVNTDNQQKRMRGRWFGIDGEEHGDWCERKIDNGECDVESKFKEYREFFCGCRVYCHILRILRIFRVCFEVGCRAANQCYFLVLFFYYDP